MHRPSSYHGCPHKKHRHSDGDILNASKLGPNIHFLRCQVLNLDGRALENVIFGCPDRDYLDLLYTHSSLHLFYRYNVSPLMPFRLFLDKPGAPCMLCYTTCSTRLCPGPVTNIPTRRDAIDFRTINCASSQAPCGGIPAAHVTSTTQSSIAKQIFTDLARARKGKEPTIKLLYVTPERLGNSDAMFGIMTALHDQVGACSPRRLHGKQRFP